MRPATGIVPAFPHLPERPIVLHVDDTLSTRWQLDDTRFAQPGVDLKGSEVATSAKQRRLDSILACG